MTGTTTRRRRPTAATTTTWAPPRSRRLAPLLLLPLLALAGCGEDDATPAGADEPAGACLSGAEECADIPTGTGGVTSGPDGSLAVADALSVDDIDGHFVMSGYVVDDGSQPRLCQALLESMPPQCGGESIPLETGSAELPGDLTTEGGVSWSEQPTSVEGEIVDGVFVVGSP